MIAVIGVVLLAAAGITAYQLTRDPGGGGGTGTDGSGDGSAETATPADWSSNSDIYANTLGPRFTLSCPSGGTARTGWGTDVYTSDSSVCTAAVHAGLITLAEGGRVRVEIKAGQDAYQGSTRNGVTSQSYGSWGGSFSFLR